MSTENMDTEKPQEDINTEEDISYTQVACSAIGGYTSPMMRQSLRVKLEREKEAQRQQRSKSVIGSFRNLFG